MTQLELSGGRPLKPTEVVAQRVRELRGQRGWSAQDLADRCAAAGMPELNRSVLANLESGRRPKASIDEVLVLAYVLDVAPAHLFVPVSTHGQVSITPELEIDPGYAHRWVRGAGSLPGQDERIFEIEAHRYQRDSHDRPEHTAIDDTTRYFAVGVLARMLQEEGIDLLAAHQQDLNHDLLDLAAKKADVFLAQALQRLRHDRNALVHGAELNDGAETIARALVMAQQMAEQTIEEAKIRAKGILDDAEARARAMNEYSKGRAREITEAAQLHAREIIEVARQETGDMIAAFEARLREIEEGRAKGIQEEQPDHGSQPD